MADVHSKETRSYNMSQIKSRNTKPEMLVKKFLHAHGFRYRLHVKDLPGKPDLVLPKYKTVIFIHGCFWHGHENCKYFVVPKTRTEWWLTKIDPIKLPSLMVLRPGDNLFLSLSFVSHLQITNVAGWRQYLQRHTKNT